MITCGHCGKPLTPNEPFCGHCRTTVNAPTAQMLSASEIEAFAQFVNESRPEVRPYNVQEKDAIPKSELERLSDVLQKLQRARVENAAERQDEERDKRERDNLTELIAAHINAEKSLAERWESVLGQGVEQISISLDVMDFEEFRRSRLSSITSMALCRYATSANFGWEDVTIEIGQDTMSVVLASMADEETGARRRLAHDHDTDEPLRRFLLNQVFLPVLEPLVLKSVGQGIRLDRLEDSPARSLGEGHCLVVEFQLLVSGERCYCAWALPLYAKNGSYAESQLEEISKLQLAADADIEKIFQFSSIDSLKKLLEEISNELFVATMEGFEQTARPSPYIVASVLNLLSEEKTATILLALKYPSHAGEIVNQMYRKRPVRNRLILTFIAELLRTAISVARYNASSGFEGNHQSLHDRLWAMNFEKASLIYQNAFHFNELARADRSVRDLIIGHFGEVRCAKAVSDAWMPVRQWFFSGSSEEEISRIAAGAEEQAHNLRESIVAYFHTLYENETIAHIDGKISVTNKTCE